MSPQIGQRINYRLTAGDVDFIQRTGAHAGGQGQAQEGQVLTAVITALPQVAKMGPVLDDQGNPTGQMQPTGELRTAVNVKVFLDGPTDLWRPDVVAGTSNGQWSAISEVDVQAQITDVRSDVAGLREELAALRAQTAPVVAYDPPAVTSASAPPSYPV